MSVDKFGKTRDDVTTRDDGVSLSYINNFFLRKDGTTKVTGSINMNGNTLTKVSNPANPQDVATKNYVDNTKGSGVIGGKKNDSFLVKGSLDFDNTHKLKNLPPPAEDGDAVNKMYTDRYNQRLRYHLESINPFTNQNGYEAKDKISMKGFSIENVRNPQNENDAVNKMYTDKKIEDLEDNQAFEKRTKGGYQVKGDIHFRKKKITGLPDPVNEKEAVDKRYVDNITKEYANRLKNLPFLKENGHYKATANIDMGTKRLANLPEPSANDDATSKRYVDEKVNAIVTGNVAVVSENPFLKENGAYITTTKLNMGFNPILNLPNPTEPYEAVHKRYVDNADAFKKTNKVTDSGGNEVAVLLSDGPHYVAKGVLATASRVGLYQDSFTSDNDAVNKKYVDEAIKNVGGGKVGKDVIKDLEKNQAFYYSEEDFDKVLSGRNYVVKSSLQMNDNLIHGLKEPFFDTDAATKRYVDREILILKSYVDEQLGLRS